ncbi:hypothetical protein [Haliscomenobacter hydrossis]|uniref:Uncharacterized protein n=1 Tax=Haliscomenobacter hydrossis (strain ATCC 27775 / DSM 1100 / LMG 10767 / O) TaxID=760192 RepID=F4KVI0_HALH1|nr:hypothetical protein [Haliscomenobacter hydrossis]AEE51293.1 hypothetical protein Halhy_3437 [Haliscomenobacter hydrossis DSM 1100]
MTIKIPNLAPIQPKKEILESPTPKPRRGLWWLVVFAVAVIYAAFNVEDFDFLVEKDGQYKLAPKRNSKLYKELGEIDNAEQYVLLVTKAGFYPCYNCGKSALIFLNVGEVWKYGVTRIGRDKRYNTGEIPKGLEYLVEFRGDYAQCLKFEKIQIYHYALLPENLSRDVPLIRPPGNKVDQ